jgi:hypothetical protein
MLSSLAKSFSLEPSSSSSTGAAPSSGRSQPKNNTPAGNAHHSAFVRSTLVPLTVRIQKEVRGRKYKVRS